MRVRNFLLPIATLFLLGCSNPPLLFSSGVSFGVDMSINGSATNPVNLTVGYKQLDATMVPVTVSGQDIIKIQGCSTRVIGSGGTASCTGIKEREGDEQPAGTKATALRLTAGNGFVPAMNAIAVPDSKGKLNSQTASSNDALSVFSSFNAGVSAKSGTNAGATIGLGKVFATGVAAQNLTDGQATAAIYLATSPAGCLQSLAALLNSGKAPVDPTPEMIKICAITQAKSDEQPTPPQKP